MKNYVKIKDIFRITMEFTVYITYLSVALLSLFHLFLLQEEYSSCNVDNHYWVSLQYKKIVLFGKLIDI